MKARSKIKRILAGIMAASMAISLVPTLSYAAQSNEYVDPADVWIEANGGQTSLISMRLPPMKRCIVLFVIWKLHSLHIVFPNTQNQVKLH